MKRITITLALLLGLNLSAQEKKAYQLENGVVKIEQFYATGEIQQISFYLEGQAFGTWLKYDQHGNLISKAKIENGRPVKIFHYDDGITTIIDRKKNSVTKIKP
jgi:antitoxin component YwqK of YwqJK toxin-antitoxin module